jgi:hypothetical protein
MTKIAHAWIREVRSDGSQHRIGCMAATRISPNKARIAFSLCAPGDKMDVKKAKRLAMRRLTESKTKTIVIDMNKQNVSDWATSLNICSLVDKQTDSGVRCYAETKNDLAILGLLSEVCPVK